MKDGVQPRVGALVRALRGARAMEVPRRGVLRCSLDRGGPRALQPRPPVANRPRHGVSADDSDRALASGVCVRDRDRFESPGSVAGNGTGARGRRATGARRRGASTGSRRRRSPAFPDLRASIRIFGLVSEWSARDRRHRQSGQEWRRPRRDGRARGDRVVRNRRVTAGRSRRGEDDDSLAVTATIRHSPPRAPRDPAGRTPRSRAPIPACALGALTRRPTRRPSRERRAGRCHRFPSARAMGLRGRLNCAQPFAGLDGSPGVGTLRELGRRQGPIDQMAGRELRRRGDRRSVLGSVSLPYRVLHAPSVRPSLVPLEREGAVDHAREGLTRSGRYGRAGDRGLGHRAEELLVRGSALVHPATRDEMKHRRPASPESRSERRPYLVPEPLTCSGDMYAGVPRVIPARVARNC